MSVRVRLSKLHPWGRVAGKKRACGWVCSWVGEVGWVGGVRLGGGKHCPQINMHEWRIKLHGQFDKKQQNAFLRRTDKYDTDRRWIRKVTLTSRVSLKTKALAIPYAHWSPQLQCCFYWIFEHKDVCLVLNVLDYELVTLGYKTRAAMVTTQNAPMVSPPRNLKEQQLQCTGFALSVKGGKQPQWSVLERKHWPNDVCSVNRYSLLY